MADISIANIAPTDANARALRAVNKFGLNLADFAGLTTNSRFDGFGNGTGYTVSSWISDGVFADLAAVQAVYPICQSGSDKVDWVLLQSAIDFVIYGALGTSNKKNMKGKLFIPAGQFIVNRTLHVGYRRIGTPPADLNGNGYITIEIEGEGPQFDAASGNGMNGTTIFTENYTYPAFAVTGYQQVKLRNFTVQGPYNNWFENNAPLRAVNNWNRTAWRPPGIADANWFGGAAVNIGIGLDLYSSTESALAYPPRVLPSYFGGGTTTLDMGASGGTDVSCDNVNIKGFIIGYGRVHGDSNAEFIRFNRGNISNCLHSFVCGHSQNRNIAITNTNIAGFHTAISNQGGLQGNANLHGLYSNIHFGQGYQLIDQTFSGWSGPITFRDCYAESFFRIGRFGRLKLDGCFLSMLEQESFDGVPHNHVEGGVLTLDNSQIGGLRHGLMSDCFKNGASRIELSHGSIISAGQASNFALHPNLAQIQRGTAYLRNIFHAPGGNRRIVNTEIEMTDYGRDGLYPTNAITQSETFFDQKFTSFYPQFPFGENNPSPVDSYEMQGVVHRFPVPKIGFYRYGITVSSRSGTDIICSRGAIGDIKTDVGDVFAIRPPGADDALRVYTWFIVVEVTLSTMTLRQISNYDSTNETNYFANDFYQVGAGSYDDVYYICTRIRQNWKLWVGDVTSGSAVITNVKNAHRFGADVASDFTSSNCVMEVGDYFLHQEIERANTGGSGLKVHNRISAIDFTANTITLTENFNITRTNYPIVFYVETFNA